MNALSVPARSGVLSTARDYISLLKLRIVLLLDATAIGVMIPAAHGHPRVEAVLAVFAGGTLAAGGAHAINCWFDRDIDAEMTRTRRRPIPDGRIPAWHALVLGIALVALSFVVLLAWANLLAAVLALAGAFIYVFVYTIWLKRWTPLNIVIGGSAGAVPPLVGWAAATGRLDFTALAHAVLTAIVSVVPFFTGSAGTIYFAGATVLGVGLVAMTVLDLSGRRWTRRVFTYSIVYVALLFGLFAISPFIP